MKDQKTNIIEAEPKMPPANGSPSKDISPNLVETSDATKTQIKKTMSDNKIDQVIVEELKPKIIMAVRASTKQSLNFDDEGFNTITQPEKNPRNYIWVGPVKHITISHEPPLVATFFTQKMRKNETNAPTKNSIHLVISSAPIERDNLIANYDDSLATEEISFTVEFDYDGKGRHSLKHRYVSPKFSGRGLGNEILKEYENLFQKMADIDQGNLTQANILDTNKLDTMSWAAKNNYVPDTDEDKKRWQEIQQRKTEDGETITVVSENSVVIQPKDAGKSARKIYVKFKKEFPSRNADHAKMG